MRRFSLLATMCAVAALAVSTGAAWGQDYPNRPIRIIVPWPPGGSVDQSARFVGDEMSRILGQNIVLENKGGAGGAVGSLEGARARPDGYTLTFGNAASHATNVVAIPDLGYDPVKDFAPISLVHRSTMSIAVAKDAPIKSLDDLLAYLRQNPDTPYGSPGVGTPQHMVGELLNRNLGLKLQHVVYRGGGPVVTDLVGQHIKVADGGLSQFLQLNEQGQVRVVAIADLKRYAELPQVATLAEKFPGTDVSGWGSLDAPAGTDPGIVEKLRDTVHKALTTERVAKLYTAAGLQPAPSSGDELVKLIASDIANWRALKASGVEINP